MILVKLFPRLHEGVRAREVQDGSSKQKKGRGATHTRRSPIARSPLLARSGVPKGVVELLSSGTTWCPNCGYHKDREVVVTE